MDAITVKIEDLKNLQYLASLKGPENGWKYCKYKRTLKNYSILAFSMCRMIVENTVKKVES